MEKKSTPGRETSLISIAIMAVIASSPICYLVFQKREWLFVVIASVVCSFCIYSIPNLIIAIKSGTRNQLDHAIALVVASFFTPAVWVGWALFGHLETAKAFMSLMINFVFILNPLGVYYVTYNGIRNRRQFLASRKSEIDKT